MKLDNDLEFESENGIHIDKYIKIEKGAVYNDQGYVTVNNYPNESTVNELACAKDDEDIHMAITHLYEATDDKGNMLFTEQGQWYAVYRVLKEYCNYPEKMSDFDRLIKRANWADKEPFCNYDSIRCINKSLPLLSLKVSLWQQHKSSNEKYFKQCIVAEFMLKELGII